MTNCALDQNGLTLRPGACAACVAMLIYILFTMTPFCDMKQGFFSPKDFSNDDYERLGGFMRSLSLLHLFVVVMMEHYL